ncbi:cinnamoyl-CoA reductase 1-like [Cucumis melo var. makuwa]|uniref:Cinnamoyl-CoA reductase 1-like n=1 Tax=Cucumis melo var. makuwa TaxID=1194695 RepID=A0A5A7T8B3_CUCMM|nr:cinnamoyl-CoA reductase 1-like [Cucumis melo var. makuwa]TYK02004.1 cinnamoyl-CoA reductase 1-like [Cucumis melo var. makuwa]
MGVLFRSEQTFVSELHLLRRNLLSYGGLQRRKDSERFNALKSNPIVDPEEKVVCVTSGVSFLGSAIVEELSTHGYSVRVIVDNPEDVNKLEETTSGRHNVTVVVAKLTDVNSLVEAFNGCRGVFHTSSSIDPAGLSGYTKVMSEVEMRNTENVMEACSRTETVRNCVLTSSLLACIWRDQHGENETSQIVDHASWSSLELCQHKKLWLALGKLKSEKVAWKIAQESGLKLATICSALITGPNFHLRSSTATLAYLKGAREMYANGLLATVDVTKLAKAHLYVYEGMKDNAASGRYICFDRVISTADEAATFAAEIRVPVHTIVQTTPPIDHLILFQLSNKKLSDLIARSNLQGRRCLNENIDF